MCGLTLCQRHEENGVWLLDLDVFMLTGKVETDSLQQRVNFLPESAVSPPIKRFRLQKQNKIHPPAFKAMRDLLSSMMGGIK